MVWRSVEKFHAQLVADLDKSCVHIKNVVAYAVFVDFVVSDAVKQYIFFVFTLVLSFEFLLI